MTFGYIAVLAQRVQVTSEFAHAYASVAHVVHISFELQAVVVNFFGGYNKHWTDKTRLRTLGLTAGSTARQGPKAGQRARQGPGAG